MGIPPVTPELLARQREIENEMRDQGIERYSALVAKAVETRNEDKTMYGRDIMRNVVGPLKERIEDFLAEAYGSGAGRRHTAARLIKEMDTLTLAYLTVKAVVSSVGSSRCRLTAVALKVATAVEDELRYAHYQSEAGRLYSHMLQDLKKRTSNREWQRRVIVHVMNKHGFKFDEWKKATKLHLGQALIALLIEATNLFHVTYDAKQGQKKRRTFAVLEPVQDLVDIIADKNARFALLAPTKLPTVVPPKDWTGPYGGGYYFLDRPFPLITGRVNHNYLEELGSLGEQMDEVYEALNAVQAVPWRVNRRVLDVLREAWDRSLPIGKLPLRDPIELPPRPFDIDTNEEARVAWRREASKVHVANSRLASKRVQVNTMIYIAEKFEEEEAMYFPHQLDFRGRLYAMPMHLHPQGHDLAKGLLLFAEGKPIEDERALGWLMIHGANVYGYDKVSLDERVGWVEENHERIVAVAADPLAHLDWWGAADKPWQFLAFCFEYAACREHGWGYVSSLPVALDGSCNGLQHFSALLRDPVGGAATNLVPADKPADIYQEVADRVVLRLKGLIAAGDCEVAAQALAWLDFGVTRKLCKRPVMIVPYSGTMFAARRYIEDHLREAADEGHPLPWDPDALYQAAFFLAPIMWAAIEGTVVAARDGMSWLREVTKVVSASGLPMVWTTPDGFPVFQAYWDMSTRRVKTRMGDQLIYLSLSEPKVGVLNRKEQENGISPNLIHSLDACALRQYVLLARDNDVNAFSLVHDSYGTHAADTDVSAACLRHAFVNLYSDNDILARFRDEVTAPLEQDAVRTLPALPPVGTLDLEVVRDAEYFFA